MQQNLEVAKLENRLSYHILLRTVCRTARFEVLYCGAGEDLSLLGCHAVSVSSSKHFTKGHSALIFMVKQPFLIGLLDHEGEHTVTLQNIGKYRSNNTASHRRRLDLRLHQCETPRSCNVNDRVKNYSSVSALLNQVSFRIRSNTRHYIHHFHHVTNLLSLISQLVCKV